MNPKTAQIKQLALEIAQAEAKLGLKSELKETMEFLKSMDNLFNARKLDIQNL